MRVFVMLDGYTHYGEGFEFVKVEDLRALLESERSNDDGIITKIGFIKKLLAELEKGGKK